MATFFLHGGGNILAKLTHFRRAMGYTPGEFLKYGITGVHAYPNAPSVPVKRH